MLGHYPTTNVLLDGVENGVADVKTAKTTDLVQENSFGIAGVDDSKELVRHVADSNAVDDLGSSM